MHISKQFKSFGTNLDLYQSLYDFIAEARNYSMVFWLLLPVYSGSLKWIELSKTDLSGPPSFF